jgi:hypothetical protein
MAVSRRALVDFEDLAREGTERTLDDGGYDSKLKGID